MQINDCTVRSFITSCKSQTSTSTSTCGYYNKLTLLSCFIAGTGFQIGKGDTENIDFIMDYKMPPNWKVNQIETLKAQKTYLSFPVSSSSAEYSVICSMLDSVDVNSVEQVVNPTLVDKFEQRRKEMLRCKSTDRNVLSAIGLSPHEVNAALIYTKNFTPHIEVVHVPYDLNMALLFHCTSSEANIESILSDGLDERLGNASGLLGRGIYFADNPTKSMSYDRCNVIFIFAVLLGDCLSMDEKQQRLVREPKKQDDQKRHLNDSFFDSIAGRPGGANNEFVIYNRYTHGFANYVSPFDSNEQFFY